MRKLIYYVGCTVDRFIAREDGSYDFYTEGQHLADLGVWYPETIPAHVRKVLGITAENQHFDAVLMGRNTYEVGVPLGVTDPYPQLQQYIISRTMQASPHEHIGLVSGNPLGLVRELKQEPGKDIWLCGGGQLAAALYDEIDEVIMKIYPVILGGGIPMFDGRVNEVGVDLLDSNIYDNGFTLLHYRLRH